MYIVIFRARIGHLDARYTELAQRLRHKAMSVYHCQKFESFCENNQEIALSYWLSLEDIQAWKNDPEHQYAQQLGREQFYLDFSTEICQQL